MGKIMVCVTRLAMASSKKKRGKQRKAAKELATANRRDDAAISAGLRAIDNNASVIGTNNNMMSNTAAAMLTFNAIVSKIQRADNVTTRFVYDKPPPYKDSGILSIVFGFLQRCEHETFDEVIAKVGGSLDTPNVWICILAKASSREPNCRMQIAENIGPLVKCMCGDTKRLFFKSSMHWGKSILPFVGLITDMLLGEDKSETKKIIDIFLRKNVGLLRSIVQWGFWDHRPDIVKILDGEDRARIVEWGRHTTESLVAMSKGGKGGDVGKKLLQIIATTPIVSRNYDPTCMVSWVEGMIRRMKTVGFREKNTCIILKHLVGEAGYVDKGVITEVIDLGQLVASGLSGSILSDYDAAAKFVSFISHDMLMGENNLLSDSRVAFSIRAGLIEMCLHLVEQFGTHESFMIGGDYLSSLYECISSTLNHIFRISLHKKSAKAILHKSSSIEKELACLEKNTRIANNVNCKKILDLVIDILSLGGRHCCRCNKPLGRKDIKRCNGCNCMTYCSKACQKEDWLNCHSQTCNKKCPTERVRQFQGKIRSTAKVQTERDAAKLEELEINITMIQLKLFLAHSETIRNRACELNIPLCDCVVSFDLRECPPLVEFHRVSSSEGNITCVYISSFYNGQINDSDKIPCVIMQRLFPVDRICDGVEENTIIFYNGDYPGSNDTNTCEVNDQTATAPIFSFGGTGGNTPSGASARRRAAKASGRKRRGT